MRARILSATVAASFLVACGSGVQQTPAELGARSAEARHGGDGFTPPAGTVAVNFSVDDQANRVYEAGDLKWKGSFVFDEATRTLTYDATWSAGLAGWPTLYDDGPWTEGGHEPIDARAGDHVWGVTAFVTPPSAGSDVYAYGVDDALYENLLGNGWMWKGANGSFTVDPGATGPITAPGMTFEKFGHVDLTFVIDTTKLAPPGFLWDTSTVTVKSSTWGWGEIAMQGGAGGVYTLQLSDYTGKHALLVHTGLLRPGDQSEFVFTLGGFEYRNYWVDYRVFADGVTIETRGPGAPKWTPAPISWADDLNTVITVPEKPHDEPCD